MIFTSPASLLTLALSALIVVLYFLRTHRRRRDVPALALWERLPTDPQAHAARFWVRVDALLLLQLLVLAAVSLALAGPAVPTRHARLSGLAIVLDGSASLRARDAEGRPLADLARADALALFDRYPTTPIVLFELSAAPRRLAEPAASRETVRRALAEWQPTWYADGSAEDLAALLASQEEAFERVVLLTDAAPSVALDGVEVRTFSPGDNIALTSFSVREDPTGRGPVAFVTLRNDTSAYRELAVRVSDGARRAAYPALLAPGEEQSLVLPFPGSVGTVFTASVEGDDAFAADDERAFSLTRRADLRVRVVGTIDRYLRAALTSAGARLIDSADSGAVDLTVVCAGAQTETLPERTLLVHASLPGVMDVSADRAPGLGSIVVDAADDPLLAAIDPLDIVLRSAPTARPLVDGVTVLSAGGVPLLWRAEIDNRRVVFLGVDPLQTNLPLSVDFPLLVWNAIRWLCLVDAEPPLSAAVVGQPIAFARYGIPERLRDPAGREIAVGPDAPGFRAKAPGVYELTTSAGVVHIAVNVAASESPIPRLDAAPLEAPTRPVEDALEAGLLPLWRGAAILALIFLGLESLVTQRRTLPRRRA